MDDEIKIDLKPMIEILILRWRWIVGVPVAVTFVALVAALLMPRVYDARVFVAVSKQKVEVQFGTQIQTLTEEQLGMSGIQTQASRDARLATFRELVTNPAIGEEVLPQFADRLRQLDEDLLNTSRFLADHVSVDQNTKSDLIGIVITLRDPVLAAEQAFKASLQGGDVGAEQTRLHLFEQVLHRQQGMDFRGVEPQAG